MQKLKCSDCYEAFILFTMKSQVSFKFDGEHNKKPVISILKSSLKGMRFLIENENKFCFRIYVGALETEEKVLKICRVIQCFSVLDRNRLLNAS